MHGYEALAEFPSPRTATEYSVVLAEIETNNTFTRRIPRLSHALKIIEHTRIVSSEIPTDIQRLLLTASE